MKENEFSELKAIVEKAYAEGTTLEEAERLAAHFLGAQMRVAEELAQIDLDSRMKKSGLKAIKAAVYMEAVSKADKKPAEGWLENHVALNELVGEAQTSFDTADSRKVSLEVYLGIFKDAHIYFRGIAKGRFE